MSVSGSGVSFSGGGGGVDLDTIIAGGAGFADRLKVFSEAAKAARDAKADADAFLAQARTEADAMLKDAASAKAAAEEQLAENRGAAEQLREAQEAAEHERAKFAAKYDALLAAARD
jgi:hypothetical protein